MVHYAASKAGVVSITRTAAQVLATDRNHFRFELHLPWCGRHADVEEDRRRVDRDKGLTSLIPIGRPETPEDVAGRG
jgi:NAD(P)-dependent dehydrogenase (short-subunit alcohol dehydrogenase family)